MVLIYEIQRKFEPEADCFWSFLLQRVDSEPNLCSMFWTSTRSTPQATRTMFTHLSNRESAAKVLRKQQVKHSTCATRIYSVCYVLAFCNFRLDSRDKRG